MHRSWVKLVVLAMLNVAVWGQTTPLRSRYFTVLTNTEVEEYLRRNDVIVIPVGTAEAFNNMPTAQEYTMAEAMRITTAPIALRRFRLCGHGSRAKGYGDGKTESVFAHSLVLSLVA